MIPPFCFVYFVVQSEKQRIYKADFFMRFDILTIFPHIFDSYFGESIIGRAKKEGYIEIVSHDLRQWTTDKHHKTDDTPYGGGAGMVMKVEPIFNAVQELEAMHMQTRTVLFSAKGKRFTQEDAQRLTQYDRLIFICGRYEGVDERVAEYVVDEEISIGDFVLTGGEIPAMAVVDAVARLLPGVLGNETSPVTESHTEAGYLEHPQYTKPEEFNGWRVPDVLLSGHHGNVEQWRKEQSGKINDV